MVPPLANGYSPAALLNARSNRRNMGTNGPPKAPPRPEATHGHPSTPTHYQPSLLLNPRGHHSGSRHSTNMANEPSSTDIPELGGASTAPFYSARMGLNGSSHAAKPGMNPSGAINTLPQFLFDSTAPSHEGPLDLDDERTGMGGMLEKLHNVEARQDRPVKRQKLQHDENGDFPSVSFRGGASSELAQHIKEKRKEGAEKAKKTTGPTIDLTLDEEKSRDEDVEIVGSRSNADREVCYGRVDSAKVTAHAMPNVKPGPLFTSKTDWPSIKVELKRMPASNHIIRVLDPLKKDFGTVDIRTALALAPLFDAQIGIRTSARLENRKKKAFEPIPGQPVSDSLKMILNLYGPFKHADKVGRFLSQKNVYLTAPLSVEAGMEIFNPQGDRQVHAPRHSRFSGGGRCAYTQRTAEEIKADVDSVFSSLQKNEDLPALDGPVALLRTPLLHHQQQALWFMTEREKPRSPEEADRMSLWRSKMRHDGRKIYYNVITGNEEFRRPDDVRGGLLADEMGLGKTLSILSLMASTLGDAVEWVETADPKEHVEGFKLKNVKTTLLVCPLSVVSNWEEQIRAHIQQGGMSFYVYHGNSRLSNLDKLAEYDIIVTTYSIVSSEFNRRGKKADFSPFARLNFFRIVLDEAHIIREQSTMQSKAICAIEASRRWALTGTPVQNRLDDFGALVKFLRVKPFDDPGSFAQYILSPFKNADVDVVPKLRVLVDTITLRRMKGTINLPPRHDDIVRLEFSEDERKLYDLFSSDATQRLEIIAKNQAQSRKPTLGGKNYAHMLRSILCLRLICAHGRELLREDDLKMTEGMTASTAIDLEDNDITPEVTARWAYEMYTLTVETDQGTCLNCLKKVAAKDPFDEEGKEVTFGILLGCLQLSCIECWPAVKAQIDKATIDGRYVCFSCRSVAKCQFRELCQAGLDLHEEQKRLARENPKSAKMVGRYVGPHTKTKALVAELLASDRESDDPEHEGLPFKSVVFSGWTTHLDLIQMALDDARLRYVRLDGSVTRSNRRIVLDSFREDPDIRIILISISAGGLGLNLTAASKVYVMEPQYNPAAEAQAVDRVHRLGQEREVFVKRFIMSDSIEERMLKLQKQKQSLAEMSLAKGKLDPVEARKQRLENLRSLFR